MSLKEICPYGQRKYGWASQSIMSSSDSSWQIFQWYRELSWVALSGDKNSECGCSSQASTSSRLCSFLVLKTIVFANLSVSSLLSHTSSIRSVWFLLYQLLQYYFALLHQVLPSSPAQGTCSELFLKMKLV